MTTDEQPPGEVQTTGTDTGAVAGTAIPPVDLSIEWTRRRLRHSDDKVLFLTGMCYGLLVAIYMILWLRD
jgi:hypothetical protein